MRLTIFCISLLFTTTNLKAQINLFKKEVDSVHGIINSLKITDSVAIANQYYKIGEYYRYSSISDSAFQYYQKAEKTFKKFNLDYERAITLYGVASIQRNEKDFTGSESTSIEALSILESLNETNLIRRYKAYIYNNLGIVFDELEQFEESIRYYKIALKLKKGLRNNNKVTIVKTLNNMIKVYMRSGQYNLAIEKYNELIKNKKILKKTPSLYSNALVNYASTLYLLKDFSQLPDLYHKALKICKNSRATYQSIYASQHLSEYYLNLNQTDSAKYYAYKAKKVSEQFYADDMLKSLLLLSKVETGETKSKYLEAYVKFNDSLSKLERLNRDKYARIKYETNKIAQENIQIAKERFWLLIIAVIIIIASFLLYLVISQRIKNKELQFVQNQQKANEEIYNLMLSQNESIEKARTAEKKRISEELHDGVLGRLFGTRLSLDSLNMTHTKEAIETRGDYIDELKSIEQDIRKVSHELNTDFISNSSFINIVKSLLETQTEVYNIKYKLKHNDSINWDDVPNIKKINIYRIIQESLHNIYKHAKATIVIVSFSLTDNLICLKIKDDGSGFNVNKLKSGIGLKNMKSRIKNIGGTLNITSKKGVGTEVIIEVEQ